MASEFPKDTIGQPPAGGGMIGRIQRLLMSPKTEWAAIDAEPMTTQGIMTGWVLPLAAIGPVAHLIQTLVFPLSIFGVSWRPSPVAAVITAVVSLVLTMVVVWLWSLLINALAPNFGGTKNPISALKVAAFSATAAWICGIFQILPLLGILGLLGLYSAYLFWIGLPMLMKVPEDKAVGYVVVTVLVGIVAGFVVGVISAALVGMMFVMTPGNGITTPGGSVTIGGTTIDTGKLDAAAASLKASTEKMQASINGNGEGVKAVDPTALQNLLPASIAGWNRTSVENQGGGAAGLNGSNARAQFQAGDQSFSLSVTDMGALGSIATLGGAVNASSNRQTATGYEKTEMQGGNMVSEKWDNQSKSGSYSVMVASRFAVEANGSAPGIDVLKSAVASVDVGSLQGLAK